MADPVIDNEVPLLPPERLTVPSPVNDEPEPKLASPLTSKLAPEPKLTVTLSATVRLPMI